MKILFEDTFYYLPIVQVALRVSLDSVLSLPVVCYYRAVITSYQNFGTIFEHQFYDVSLVTHNEGLTATFSDGLYENF